MMSVESWKVIFDWASVMLVGLTFIAGSGALLTGRVLNRRQDAQLRTFEKEIAGTQLELGTAQLELESQKEKTAKAEAELAKLHARTEYRHLTPEQQRLLAEKLRRFAGMKVAFVVFWSENDSSSFRDDIRKALTGPNGAGWIERGGAGIGSSAPEVGVVLEVNTTARQEAVEAANVLAEGLRSEGVFVPPVRPRPTPEKYVPTEITDWDIRISIERRP
jgi:hypothetical protein